MADCVSLPACPFFNEKIANMPGTTKVMQAIYCKGDSGKCARFIVSKALGKSAVPIDLFPDQINKANEIISTSKQ